MSVCKNSMITFHCTAIVGITWAIRACLSQCNGHNFGIYSIMHI